METLVDTPIAELSNIQHSIQPNDAGARSLSGSGVLARYEISRQYLSNRGVHILVDAFRLYRNPERLNHVSASLLYPTFFKVRNVLRRFEHVPIRYASSGDKGAGTKVFAFAYQRSVAHGLGSIVYRRPRAYPFRRSLGQMECSLHLVVVYRIRQAFVTSAAVPADDGD